MSRLAFSQDPARLRLLISSDPPHANCVSLRLNDEGVDVLARGLDPAVLPWQAYAPRYSAVLRKAPDGWIVNAYGSSSESPGIGIRVSGLYKKACGRIIDATSTWWRELTHPDGSDDTDVLPVVSLGPFAGRAPLDTVGALMRVLAARPELRPQLEQPERAWRLATDLHARLLRYPVRHVGVLRDTIDTITALRALGYVHPFGRPIAGEPKPSLEEVVRRTHEHLDASPWREGRKASDAEITRIVCEEYYDIDPWPFAALVPSKD